MNTTELKELAAKATPGPWKAISRGAYWDEEEGDVDAVSGPEIIGAEFVEPLSNQQTTRGHCWYRDAAYIAAANPAEILEMIAQLEDAQGEIRALRATEAGLRERVKELEQQLAEARKDAMSAAALICDALPAPPSCNVLERNLWDVATVAAADAIRAAIKEQT